MNLLGVKRKIVFNLFREWTKNALTDNPNSDFTMVLLDSVWVYYICKIMVEEFFKVLLSFPSYWEV